MLGAAKGQPAAPPAAGVSPRSGGSPVALLTTVAAALGALDLIGWIFHLPRLTSVFAHYATMKPNTGLSIYLLGIACLMRRRIEGPDPVWRRIVALSAASIALVVPAGTLLEYATGVDLRLDHLLLLVAADQFGDPSGRMALGTSLCLTLLALAVLLMETLPRWSVAFFLTVGVVALSAVVGFVFNAGPLYGVPWFKSLAVHSAFAILLLSLGGLAARPEREPAHSLLQKTYRDGRTRWLLAGVTLLPMVVAFLPLMLMRHGAADEGFTLALVVVVLTCLQTALLWRDSMALARAEQRRVQVERALIQSEKLAVVGRLSASVSHEIRNPLDAVGSLLYLIRGSESIAEIHGFARTAEDEMERIRQISSQTLSSYRENRAVSSYEPSELVESALHLLHGKIVAGGITVTRRYQPEMGRVTCRDGEMRQVFLNILSNALEATPHGGHIVVKCRRSRTWTATSQPVKGIRILFADNGTGMPEEVRRQIFEPFYTTKVDTGNGLGLWVVRDLLEKAGGSIKVWSSMLPEATGTVFAVFLPLLGEES